MSPDRHTAEATPAASPDTPVAAATDHERISELLLSLCPIDPPPLADDLFLIADLGFDSLGLLELVSALEVEFDLSEVPEEEALEIETVGDLRRLLEGSTVA